MADANSKRCLICGESARPQDPLCPDGMDDEVLMHLSCYNSPGAQAWRAQMQSADPAFDRWSNLMTVGVDFNCPACSAALRRGPKAVGMCAGSWTVHCTRCHRQTMLSEYGGSSQACDMMEQLRADFVRSRRLEEI